VERALTEPDCWSMCRRGLHLHERSKAKYHVSFSNGMMSRDVLQGNSTSKSRLPPDKCAALSKATSRVEKVFAFCGSAHPAPVQKHPEAFCRKQKTGWSVFAMFALSKCVAFIPKALACDVPSPPFPEKSYQRLVETMHRARNGRSLPEFCKGAGKETDLEPGFAQGK